MKEKYLLSELPSASDGHEKEGERIEVKLLHVTWMFFSHQNIPLEPLLLPVERMNEWSMKEKERIIKEEWMNEVWKRMKELKKVK